MVSWRDYVDRGLGDLARYHDKNMADTREDFGRRLAAMTRETDQRFTQVTISADAAHASHDAQLAHMDERTKLLEAALEQSKGRQAAWNYFMALVIVGVTLLTLFINHVRF